jgi:hypothetical protein
MMLASLWLSNPASSDLSDTVQSAKILLHLKKSSSNLCDSVQHSTVSQNSSAFEEFKFRLVRHSAVQCSTVLQSVNILLHLNNSSADLSDSVPTAQYSQSKCFSIGRIKVQTCQTQYSQSTFFYIWRFQVQACLTQYSTVLSAIILLHLKKSCSDLSGTASSDFSGIGKYMLSNQMPLS